MVESSKKKKESLSFREQEDFATFIIINKGDKVDVVVLYRFGST